MALSVARTGVASLRGVGRSFLTPVTLRPLAAAGIVSKAWRPKDYKRPVPFPYKDTPYGFWQSLLDKTMYRLEENSKIIVVDGPIAAGKTKFAKQIAEELDMLYVPEAHTDMAYINSYGFDKRTLDPQLPPSCRSFDEAAFLRDPTHVNAASFQITKFSLRLSQYVDALAHVLSTGQGVVMDRSVYSDFVFADTMAEFGYMSKEALDYYYEARKMTVPELMRPHLVIYLDCPVNVVMQKIKARALPEEAGSPVLTQKFLTHMEHVYKQQFLKSISNHAEILIYDWSEEGDTEVVVEDIERLNFNVGIHDSKMEDWKMTDEDQWGEKRMLYTKGKNWILKWMKVPDFSIPELVVSAEDYKIYEEVLDNSPGNKFAPGYNADMGDQFIASKTKIGAEN